MHFLTESEWRERRKEVAQLTEAFLILCKGIKAMSQATVSAIAKLDALEAKIDKIVADHSASVQAQLDADEADAHAIDDRLDRISGKLDTLASPATSASQPQTGA